MTHNARLKSDALLTEARLQLSIGNRFAAQNLAIRAASIDPNHTLAADFADALSTEFRPDLSVIIPTCDRLPILKSCLMHLENQSLPPNTFEVIVVDDNSSDGTAEFLANYTPPFSFKFIIQPQRLAPAQARNIGILTARSDIILFLNDDALLCHQGLQIHLQAHRAAPDIPFSLLGSFHFPPNFTQTPWGYVLEHSDLIFDYATMNNRTAYDFFHYYTCNISTPRSALLAAGMFDSNFTGKLWGAEDIDLGYRLQNIGLPVIYRQECRAIHQHDLNVDDFARMFRVRSGGAVRIFAKNKDLPFHYRDIHDEDVRFWRNLPLKVTISVENLHKSIKKINTSEFQDTDKEILKNTTLKNQNLEKLYFSLWRLRSKEILNIIKQLQNKIDLVIKKMDSGFISKYEMINCVYSTGLFLRWFYDTIGICASETIHLITSKNTRKQINFEATALNMKSLEMNRGRILLACDFFWPSVGGTELFVEELGRRLIAEGYHVDVACRALPERLTHIRHGMRIYQFYCHDRFHDASMGSDIKIFQRHILESGYKSVLALAHPDTWICHALHTLSEHNRPTIIMMPSMNNENLRLWRQKDVMDKIRAILHGADTLITVSENGIDATELDAMGIPHTFIPHAVTSEASPENSRTRYALTKGRPLLACVGNFWPVKNQANLLSLMQSMPGDWQLVLAGAALPWPHERDYFLQCFQLASRDPRIRILGPLPPLEAAALIRDADILLVPSQGESAGPLVVLQAMAFGVPWIATPECNAVEDEAGGIIVPLKNFPEAIQAMFSAPKLARSLAKMGKKHWNTCFNWINVLPKFVDCIEGRKSTISLHMPQNIRKQRDIILSKILHTDEHKIKNKYENEDL